MMKAKGLQRGGEATDLVQRQQGIPGESRGGFRSLSSWSRYLFTNSAA